MIVYLDTSALVKLFFLEAGSEIVIDLVKKADSVVTSQVAYAESCSALARRKRDKRLTEEEFQKAIENLDDLMITGTMPTGPHGIKIPSPADFASK